MSRQATRQRPVDLPRWVYLPALLGAAFVLRPACRDRGEGRLAELRRPDHLRGLPGCVVAQPAHLRREHPGVHRARRADGHGARPVGLAGSSACCARWSCSRSCCLRSSGAWRCSTPSAAAGSSASRSTRSAIQIAFSTIAVVMAQTFVALPFLVVSLEGALRTAGDRYEVAAASLGASPTTVFRRITLPLVMPGLISGSVLAFARALGEFGATITFAGSLQGRTRTLPLEIYLQRETDPDAAVALALVLLVVAGRGDRLRPAGTRCAVTVEVTASRPASATSRRPSRSATARPSPCSVPTARASRRCWASSPGWSARPPAGSCSTARRSPTSAPVARARWSRRTPVVRRCSARTPCSSRTSTRWRTSRSGHAAAALPGVRRARTPSAGSTRSASATSPTGGRGSSPAARPSGWRSPAPWRRTLGCSCSTSRWLRSTSPCSRRCARCCGGCSPTARRSWSPTTRSTRCCSPTAWSCWSRAGWSRRDRAATCSRAHAARSPAGWPGLNLVRGTWHDDAVRSEAARGARPRRGRRARRGRAGHRGVPAAGRRRLPRRRCTAARATPSPSR